MFHRNLVFTIIIASLVLLSAHRPANAQEQPSAESVQNEEAVAQPEKPRLWKVRVAAVAVDADGRFSVEAGSDGASTDVNIGAGFSVRFERTLTPRLGIELGLAGIASGVDVSADWADCDRGTSVDMLTMAPITVGLNVHLTPDSPVDVYVGPMLAIVNYSDIRVRSGWDCDGDDDTFWDFNWDAKVRSKSDSDLTWGLNAGADIAFGSSGRWSAHLGLTYIETTAELKRDFEGSRLTHLRMDPLMFNIGFAYAF